ncbi:tRNA glutamyl-Q(34) synthetase GluQRS [Endozoicomonas ascidiicola]|uniref:tRNA glutamyl-Q(34) synthetase GluQRS n=1 Tax=Endozoicomonas ascidiicola TaxID=1698521 RepID=UPI00082C75A2|nr:tRNA glutamyl-Q(34) synthetase GluQRS [Endozoicomonas ascidiicola]
MGNQPDSYIGRFAPSPSGPLHFGSLVAALASYLDARANNGKWLVRIEDIDPPREPAGTADLILKTLEAYGLHWDDSVLYQSTRSQCYDDVLEHLLTTEELYPCICTRKQLSGLNGVYPGYCRDNRNVPSQPHALRLRCHDQVIHFTDRIQGRYSFDLSELGDFTLKRKDGLYAYQLAVSVDDYFQGVTHIVRGVDLLDSTPRQIHLQNQLGYPNPMYAHIPVIVESDGNKLSKQNHAPAIPQDEPRPLMIKAFSALGMQADNQLEASTIEEILQWGIENWSPTALLQKSKILQTSIQ